MDIPEEGEPRKNKRSLKQAITRFRDDASLRTIIGLGVVALLAQAGWATLNFSALPVWVQYELHKGRYLGFILGSFMLTEALLRPWLGALSDRIGRKPLMLMGPVLSIFTALATIHTSSPVVLVLLRAVDGIGLAAFWPSAFAAVGDAVDEEHRGSAMAVVNGTGLAGIALAMPLGGMANDLSHSLTGAFYAVAVIFAVTVVAGILIFPREAHKHVHAEEEEHLHLRDKAEVSSVLHLVPDMLILSVIVFTAIGLLMPIVKLYAMEQLGMKETQFGWMVFPIAIILGGFSVPLGKLGDKYGKVPTFCYGLLFCSLGMWLIATIRSITVVAGASVLLGVGFALAMPAWMAMAAQAGPSSRRGQVLGAVGMAQGIGAIIGVAVGPIIYSSDWMSLPQLGVVHFNLPFYLCAVLLSICTVMAFLWISGLRSRQNSGREIGWMERRAIMAAALVGLMIIAGWVVIRYTRPLPADRIAWLWVRDEVHMRPMKAERFTIPAFEKRGPDNRTASATASRVYSRWVTKEKARYTLMNPDISENGQTAEVRLVFRFPDGRTAEQVIKLVRQPNGEWRVSGQVSEPSSEM